MANYYTHFSCLLPLGSATNAEAALAVYERLAGELDAQDEVIGFAAEVTLDADEAEPISAFPSVLRSLASTASYVYLDVPNHSKRSRASSPKSLLKVRIVCKFDAR